MQTIPAKQQLKLNGTVLEYVKSGSGTPSIVLVNGAGGPIEGWYKVYPPLEKLGAVIAYNRAGIGASSKPSVPQTGDVVVETLRELLLHAEMKPPYVLVGHSIGGLFVNLFARLYPDEVAAVVLLDATAPDDIAVMAAHQNWAQRFLQRAMEIAFGKDEFGEAQHASRTVNLIDQAGPFPAIPLIVVTGGKPAMAWATSAQALAARADHQRRLATLSPKGKQIIAKRSGHFPQLSEPAVVVGAVREAVSLIARDRQIA